MDEEPPSSDLGFEQRHRIHEEEGAGPQPVVEESPESQFETDDPPAEERDLEQLEESASIDELRKVDGELAEDLRRAEPNPPITVPMALDPDSDVDLGYLEDEDARSDDHEEGAGPVELDTVDPLLAEREERDRPGRSDD